MIQTVCPTYLGTEDSFYQTAPVIAAQGVFEGYYSFHIAPDVAGGVAQTRQLFAQYHLCPVGFRVPLDIGLEAAEFAQQVAAFAPCAQTAAAIGYRQALTWVMPGSNTQQPADYLQAVARNLRCLCAMLWRHGIMLGVELVAPQTLRAGYRYPSPCRTEDLLRLIELAGCDGLGVILDAFHFYCAGHDVADYALFQSREQIVMAHISDGVSGRTAAQQLDLDRRLPGMTGEIATEPFFACLKRVGYTGAVIPEPLDPALAALSFDQALARAADAMQRIWPRDE